MPIIISQKGVASASVIDKSDFENEDKLQKYIHEHPEAIPVYEIHHDKRLWVVAREVDTQSGPIDALAVDKDGDVYLVETKLQRNSDKRRVVAQVLDYGASLWKHTPDFEAFLSLLDQHVRHKWGMNFQEKLKDRFDLDDERVGFVLASMRRNLEHGNFKFVVLMDAIDDALRDLITYINQKSQFDIYGVEVEFYRHLDYEILIPRIYGVEVKKDHPTERIALTREKLLEDIRSKYQAATAAWAERLMAKLDTAGLRTEAFPSCINYGVEVSGDFLSILSFTPTNIWPCVPKRAISSLGGRFTLCKERINSVAKFYKPAELSDPTKSGAFGPRYAVLLDKLEPLVEAVSFIATELRNTATAAV